MEQVDITAENGSEITVELMDASPLWVAICAIRKCWRSEGDSDSYFLGRYGALYPLNEYNATMANPSFIFGIRDKALLRKVISLGHESTIEHLKYTFDIKGMSRAILQELARHRIASLSVESSRYTLGRILRGENVSDYMVASGDADIDALNREHMARLAELATKKRLPNDVLKYGMVEAWKTELVWSVNARSLRNFLKLRTSKRAHREIRALAQAVHAAIPESHRPLFDDVVATQSTHIGSLSQCEQGCSVNAGVAAPSIGMIIPSKEFGH